MKKIISPSLPVCLLIIFLLFTGCKPEYLIETVVAYEDPVLVKVQDKNTTKALLNERLSERFGGNYELIATAGGLRLLTPHRNQPIAEIASLIGYFGSAKLGLYDSFPASDPRLQAILDSFPWPNYVAIPEQREPSRRHWVATTKNTSRLTQIQDELTNALPSGIPAIFRWTTPIDPLPGQGGTRSYELLALRNTAEGGPRIGNSGVKAAKVQPTQQGQIAVRVDMTPAATKIWEKMTREAAADSQRPVVIVVNGEVVSSPVVNSAITDGTTLITGNFSVEEAEALAAQLKWEPLPVGLKIVSQEVVE